jgi:excisionase family DNA binding protein
MKTLDIPLVISIPGAAERLAIGLSTVKLLIARGDLKTVRIGRRRLVIVASLQGYLSRLSRE